MTTLTERLRDLARDWDGSDMPGGATARVDAALQDAKGGTL